MSHRMEQINDLLRSELANLIGREIHLEDGLITVSYVKCSPNLRQAEIYVSILPEKLFGTGLKKLRQNSKIFSNALKKKLNLKYIPRFIWVIDETEKNAAKIETTLKEIEQNLD